MTETEQLAEARKLIAHASEYAISALDDDWHERASALLALPAPAIPESDPPLVYPNDLTPELLDVLGRPNFWCGPIAHAMRDAGADIRRKSEDEQAHVLHWLVKLVLGHGAAWQPAAGAALSQICEKAEAARLTTKSVDIDL
ncbi:hypothetical protein EFP18_12180 [Burkholderia glumae]|uniref:hypothetical protein n=1 Tax=Burkholderia glumae TaxID=337 RepID=UPI0020366E5E|nr:hypothetical protein [Burkholderia glumae]MCM2547611.1 hypothetical protein [Burkholderia glumae]MCQ0030373.1 hypothetical protein [Burkholderia glumae]MCQ0035710.1 hypothetical protein [Burkholderia glumae]UVS84803.1 hypothetical protein EFP18_12180 [Burkholderia glumae]